MTNPNLRGAEAELARLRERTDILEDVAEHARNFVGPDRAFCETGSEEGLWDALGRLDGHDHRVALAQADPKPVNETALHLQDYSIRVPHLPAKNPDAKDGGK